MTDPSVNETRLAGGDSDPRISEKSTNLGKLERTMEWETAARLKKHDNYIASFVADVAEHNIKVEYCHNESLSPKQHLHKLNATLTEQIPGSSCSQCVNRDLESSENNRPDKKHTSIRSRMLSPPKFMASQQEAVPSAGCLNVSQKNISSSFRRRRRRFEFDVEVQRREHISELKDFSSPHGMWAHRMLTHKINCHGQINTIYAEQRLKLSQDQTCKPLQHILKAQSQFGVSKDALSEGAGLAGGSSSLSLPGEKPRQMIELQLEERMGRMLEKKTACRKLLMSQAVNRPH